MCHWSQNVFLKYLLFQSQRVVANQGTQKQSCVSKRHRSSEPPQIQLDCVFLGGEGEKWLVQHFEE